MNSTNVRKGVNQAKANEQGLFFVAVDAAVIGGIAWYVSGQWAIGLLGLVVAMFIIVGLAKNPQLSALTSVCGALIWGYAAYKLALFFEASSLSAAVVTGIVALMSFGGHTLAFQHLADLEAEIPKG